MGAGVFTQIFRSFSDFFCSKTRSLFVGLSRLQTTVVLYSRLSQTAKAMYIHRLGQWLRKMKKTRFPMFRRCSAEAGRAPTRQASVKMLQSTFPYSDNVVIFPVTPSLGRPFQALPLDQELYMYSTVGRTRPKTQSPVKPHEYVRYATFTEAYMLIILRTKKTQVWSLTDVRFCLDFCY